MKKLANKILKTKEICEIERRNEIKVYALEVGQAVCKTDVCDTRHFIDSLHATTVSSTKMALSV